MVYEDEADGEMLCVGGSREKKNREVAGSCLWAGR